MIEISEENIPANSTNPSNKMKTNFKSLHRQRNAIQRVIDWDDEPNTTVFYMYVIPFN